MKVFLAILVCKLLRFTGRLIGKGSSLPGQYALKICPDVLGRVKLPETRIAVTGSNGKTSTVEMIAAILRRSGKTVLCNEEGSNQIEGVATLILSHSTLGGRVKGDVLLLESDERYARLTFRYFHPTHLVVTNLYRDQLTRNGHPEWVLQALRDAVYPETTLILNADDPLVSLLAVGTQPDNPPGSVPQRHEKTKWFGINRAPTDANAPVGVYDDGARCPVCRGKMTYDYRHYHHIGSYRCEKCGHHRAEPDFAVTELDLKAGTLVLDGETRISLGFHSIYHAYNLLAAWAVCSLAGVDRAVMAEAIGGYMLKNGRMVEFTLGGHHGVLLTSKHENSVAYDTNLSYIRSQGTPCTVLVLVDAISRKYFTGETSWLWDIDFNLLNLPSVHRVVLCGKYVHDLALRFSFTEIPPDRVACYDTVRQAAQALKENGSEELYVVTCFSDRDKLLELTERKG